jgi:hypothetical protein
MTHPALTLIDALKTAEGAAFEAVLAKLGAVQLGQLNQAEIGQLLGAIEAATQSLRAQQHEAAAVLQQLRHGVNAAHAYKGSQG